MNSPFFKIEQYLHVEDCGGDTEGVTFKIYCDELSISREDTPADIMNPKLLPAIKGFDVTFSIESALELRDFLNFALPKENNND